jgi:hypothetical protein
VIDMTTASIRTISTHTRPSGIEALAVQLGLALVKWGRVRADRAAVAPERHADLVGTQQGIAEREHAAHRYGIVS